MQSSETIGRQARATGKRSLGREQALKRADDIIKMLGSRDAFDPDAEKPAEHIEALSTDAKRLQRAPRVGRGLK